MGVDIALFRVEQRGTSQRHRRFVLLGVYFDRGDRFAKACAGTSLPMLVRVDPYGSLVLTSEEMEQFIGELIQLAAVEGAGEFLEPISIWQLRALRARRRSCTLTATDWQFVSSWTTDRE